MVRGWLAVAAAGLVLSGCGEAASASSANDPVSVVKAYMQAAAGGQTSAAQAFLQKDISDGIPVKEPTPVSTFLSHHKGAEWRIVAVPWADAHGNALTTENACTVTPPQGGQLCIVTVEVAGGSSKVWFHFDVENRYPPGKWEILNITRVDTKPGDGLPNGSEAHAG